MKIKRIEFAEEITDINNDNIDVLVENEDSYTYTIGVGKVYTDWLINYFRRKEKQDRSFFQPE